ncbi:hypothetical protein D3C87_1679690 [compost metagenome]
MRASDQGIQSGDRVDDHNQLSAFHPLQLVVNQRNVLAADQLIGNQDSRHTKRSQYRDLVGRGRRQRPCTVFKLAAKQLR